MPESKSKPADWPEGNTAGAGIDAHGNAVLDPTKNVLDLVRAAVLRLDDMSSLRAEKSTAIHSIDMKRIDERNSMQVVFTEKIADLRAQHESEIRNKETQRLDAIRAVDVSAVAEAARVSANQASTLAAQVQASAEALRTQVATVANAQASALAAALEPIQKSIEDLRKTQYEQQGQRAAQVESKSDTRNVALDTRDERRDDTHGNQWIIGLAITLGLGLLGIGLSVAALIFKLVH